MSTPSSSHRSIPDAGSCNAAFLAGTLSSEPRLRDLPSGAVLLNLEVRVDHPERAADSVPVALFDPAASALRLTQGDAVIVVGSVRRRFFRAGATTVSRTEVVADKVVKASSRAAADRAAGAAVATIAGFAG